MLTYFEVLTLSYWYVRPCSVFSFSYIQVVATSATSAFEDEFCLVQGVLGNIILIIQIALSYRFQAVQI
jgi:hypothetical protein